jgi:hypothetical protein
VRWLKDAAGALIAKSHRLADSSVPLVRSAEAAELWSEAAKLRRDLEQLGPPVFPLFQHAADHWLRLAEAVRDETRQKCEAAMWTQVFRAADRIEDRTQTAFVRRDEIIDELQQQILAPPGSSGIIFYGRRRVGKSTVLMNLRGFLPDSVSIAYFSLQDPELLADFTGFLNQVGCGLSRAASDIASSADILTQNLKQLWRLLETLNTRLGDAGRRLLIAFDEYENLDVKIGQEVFQKDFLEALRESVQRHHNIAWLLAGSHAIEELPNVPWSSYLVAARTVEAGMFSEEETRILLTDPLRHAPLGEELRQKRVRFNEVFWGPEGPSRVHREAGGWPYLVQLIAGTLVDLNGKGQSRRVADRLLEEALGTAIVRGHSTLYLLMKGECRTPDEWDYLSGFRSQEMQPPPPSVVFDALRRRRLIVADASGCRLRVPLMQRWLRERG